MIVEHTPRRTPPALRKHPVSIRSVSIISIFEFSIGESQIRANSLWMFFWHDVGFQCARVSAQQSTMKFRKSTVTMLSTLHKHIYIYIYIHTYNQLSIIIIIIIIINMYIYIYIYIYTHMHAYYIIIYMYIHIHTQLTMYIIYLLTLYNVLVSLLSLSH